MDRFIGCGGIIRGNKGEWLGGFAKFIRPGNAYIAALSMLARSLKFCCVKLHIDSMVVVRAITCNGGGRMSGGL
jgi:ribonuclease HI